MVTLATAVGALDNVLALSASTTAAAGDRFGLDDEMVEFVQYEITAGTNKRIRQAKTENKARWLVYRGVGTTTAAAHASGTTLFGATEAFVVSDDTTEPSPIPAGGGASDAASVSFDPTGLNLSGDPDNVQAAIEAVAAAPGGTPTLAQVLVEGSDTDGAGIGNVTTGANNADLGLEASAEDGSANMSLEAYSETSTAALTLSAGSGATSAAIFWGASGGPSSIGIVADTLGFYDATPAAQPAAVADATDAASTMARLNDLLARLRTLGLIDT